MTKQETKLRERIKAASREAAYPFTKITEFVAPTRVIAEVIERTMLEQVGLRAQ